jgi:biopolymer transport protein ExbB/TolQ
MSKKGEMNMEMLQDILSIIIYTVITGAGVIIVKKVLDLVNTKIDEVQANTQLSKYDSLNKIIDQVQSVVTTAVQATNQTFVDDLKKAKKFTKESATEAKNKALETAKELITEEAANAIEQVYGNVDVYLDNLIENTVKALKK